LNVYKNGDFSYMEIYPKKTPNYPPKMAKYLLDFTFHNKKKKTFWTLDF